MTGERVALLGEGKHIDPKIRDRCKLLGSPTIAAHLPLCARRDAGKAARSSAQAAIDSE